MTTIAQTNPFKLAEVLSHFPPVDFAIAYGSAVIPQLGYNYSNSQHTQNLGGSSEILRDENKNASSKSEQSPLYDFIFAVEDAQSWHQNNLKNNSNHYSFLRFGGSSFITWIQKSFGGCIYYNTHVMLPNMEIKYGVISVSDLIEDLTDWKTLYVSGRMQKPVQILKTTSPIDNACKQNLQQALNCALLLLPETFTEKDLYATIAGLSYSGDFRMLFAENPNKVNNIVARNMDRFHNLYDPIIRSYKDHVSFNASTGNCMQSKSYEHTKQLINNLPKQIHTMLRKSSPHSNYVETIIRDGTYQTKVNQAVHKVVRKSSMTQTAKGFLTAGAKKSIVYSAQKITKSFRR